MLTKDFVFKIFTLTISTFWTLKNSWTLKKRRRIDITMEHVSFLDLSTSIKSVNIQRNSHK